MNVGSLFTGIGGFDLGLERAGHRVVRHELWDKYKQLADAVVDRATATIRQMTDDELERAKKKRP